MLAEESCRDRHLRRKPFRFCAMALCILASALRLETADAADFAAELNPIGLAATIANAENPYIFGTLTFALESSRVEIATPFALMDSTDSEAAACCEIRVRRVDLQVRRFANSQRTGRYLGLIVRLSNVAGKDVDTREPRSYDRAGLGMVWGFRRTLGQSKRVYWGANMHLGAFLDEQESLDTGTIGAPMLGGPSENGERVFFNVEFLKFGYRLI